MNCPTCKQLALHIFADESTENVWLYCNECAAAGDIITFGAAVWNMPISATIAKFVEMRAISADDIQTSREEYLRFIERRAAADAFWLRAAEGLWDCQNDEINCRLRALGVVKEVGGPPLVGIATHEQIKNFIAQLDRSRPPALLQRSAIVFPYQTFPGIYSGFLLVQYEETTAHQIFIPTATARRRPEAGYFLLQTALQPPTNVLRNTQFVVSDPFWAVKQQYMQRRFGLPPLPIMAAYFGAEARSYGKSWRAFPAASRVFHAAAHTPEIISCACNAGGYVAISQSLQNTPHQPNPTLTTLAHVKRRANTWRQALTEALSHMSELAAYSFFTKLALPPEKIATFLAAGDEQFSQNFADKVLAAIAHKRNAVPIKQDRFAVIERNGIWTSAAGRQICNGAVQIVKLIYTDKNEKFYACRATCKSNVIEFTDTAAKIEHVGLLEYTAKKFASQGVLFVYDKRWNLAAHTRAMALHEPQLVYSVNELGWSEQAQLFHFGNYDLDSAGNLRESVLLPSATTSWSFPEPLLALPPPTYRFLTPAYDNSFIWLLFSTFAANVLAPTLNELPTAVATDAAGFRLAAELWKTLGAESLEMTYAHAVHTNDRVREKTKNNNWPICAASVFDDALASYSVLHCHNRPLLLRLTPVAANAATGYGWLVCRPPELGDYNFSVFQYVLPMYVQHVLKNRIRHTAGKPLALSILRDVHSWLLANTGVTFNLTCAENSVFTQKTAHITFAHALKNAIKEEALDVLPRPRRRDQPRNYLLQQKNTWWLNRRAIDNYFKNRRSIPLNWIEIVNLWAENGVTAEEVSIHGMHGYAVDRSWCDAHILDADAHINIMGG